MNAELGASLAHVVERAHGHAAFDSAAIARLIAMLRAGERMPPALFGHYYDLVPALARGDRATAEALFAKLAATQPAPDAVRVLALDHPEITTHGDLYQRMMDTDPGRPFRMAPPSADIMANFERLFVATMDLISTTTPELADELGELVAEIIAAVPPAGEHGSFGGGSPYMLWGAMILNAGRHETRVDLALAIAHEAAHMLLFGFTVDEPLVMNDDSERYPSPLRSDPRPMDGIYHATFVTARMHWLAQRLADCATLCEEERVAAKAAAQRLAENFRAGDNIVRAHGRLSPAAKGLLGAARAAMSPIAANR